MIANILDKIEIRLKEKLPEVNVEQVEKPENFLPKFLPSVLVHFRGEKFGKPQAVGGVVQDTSVEIGITVVTKSLKSEKSAENAYVLIDEIKKALTGFEVDYEKMYPTRTALADASSGRFMYAMSFMVSASNIEDGGDDEESPLLKEGKFEENGELKIIVSTEETG